jgi:peptidoglycan/xylan/chitin deacetylase (PgdA/CDA1 family)
LKTSIHLKYRKFSDFLVHPPLAVKSLFGDITWKINTNEKIIYLTFDDGPIPYLTEKILKVLDIFNAKATFFCVGENVKKYPSIYSEILSQGHTTGNHTFSHLSGLKTNTKEYVQNIEKASEYIDSSLFRPPHGRMKSSQQYEILKSYEIVLWDVLSFDFNKNLTREDCFGNVKQFTKQGSIIVFHDNMKAEENMLYALSQTLMTFSKAGYKFKALDSELIRSHQTINSRVSILSNLSNFAFLI